MRTMKMVQQTCDDVERSFASDDISRFPEWMGAVIYETQSNFSHIRVRHRGPIRSLIFVEPSGTEQFESSMDVNNLHVPHATYLVNSLMTLLLKPVQKRVLILGLGGGSMVHFYQRYFPKTHLDVVEIDAGVVNVAKEFFGVRETNTTTIFTMDAFDFLAKSRNRYDTIYVDAFLNTKLTANADEITGRLKNSDFLQNLNSHLTENGAVAFNLLKSNGTHKTELSAMRKIFANVYGLSNPGSGNLAAIASTDKNPPDQRTLNRRAEQLDGNISLYFSFKKILSLMKPAEQFESGDD